MTKVTSLEIGFTRPVAADVLGELPGEVHMTDDGRHAALDYPAGAEPSMILRALADWLDEHQVGVEEVNLDVP